LPDETGETVTAALFHSLDEGVQRWMLEHDWNDFTPIQRAAIPALLAGNGAVLVAPTATGKTEAALLPVISEIQRQKLLPLSLLYVAPLRALVNDQTRRARVLLEECGLRVGWWHGDLPASQRKRLLSYVPDALFTTPESIEVLLSSDSYGHGGLLGDVHYVVLDEIHAFIGDDRGTQLLSLLARLEAGKRTPLVRVALSATVSNPARIAQWISSPRTDAPSISVIIDPKPRPRRVGVGYLGAGDRKDKEDEARAVRRAAQVIARHACSGRMIVFVNSRRDAETITLELKEIGVPALVHHGSIHREERERVEQSFRDDDRSVIVATSTLELGIDIGDMDLVVQIGPSFSSLSLTQRIGRSGRRAGRDPKGVVYAMFESDLAVCLAGAELTAEGIVEELYPQTAACHVLFHQIIQLLRERERADEPEIRSILSAAGSFRDLTKAEYDDVIGEMLGDGYLERDRAWLRVGPETERRFSAMGYRDFYGVFETETEWTVRTASQVIGAIDRRYPIARDRETFLVLGGRRWRVVKVDESHLILTVEPSERGPVPQWNNSGLGPSYEIMRRTFDLLCGRRSQLETDALSAKMAPARAQAVADGWQIGRIPVSMEERGVRLHTFFGTTLNAYLALLVRGNESVHGSVATSEFVVVNGLAIEPAKTELHALLQSKELREHRLGVALNDTYEGRLGKFWDYLGPKTKRHALSRYYRVLEPAIERAARDAMAGAATTDKSIITQ
jgi:ATP-dependent Lhr-like helicase